MQTPSSDVDLGSIFAELFCNHQSASDFGSDEDRYQDKKERIEARVYIPVPPPVTRAILPCKLIADMIDIEENVDAFMICSLAFIHTPLVSLHSPRWKGPGSLQ
jgi:hypothetical protein